jgi:hypothetical protein
VCCKNVLCVNSLALSCTRWYVDVLQRSSWLRDLTGFDVVPGLEGVLVGWVGGRGAQLVEEITEEEIGQQCTELLRKFTQNRDIPLPCHVIR